MDFSIFLDFGGKKKKKVWCLQIFFPCTNSIVQAISMTERSAESVVTELGTNFIVNLLYSAVLRIVPFIRINS